MPEYSIQTFTAGSDFAFASVEDDRLVIAFCGSDDLQDWINNLRALKMKVEDGRIHKGFYLSWAPFKGWVNGLVEAFNPSEIYITGHSRGAALATLCSRHIAKNLKIQCCCVAFASPRIGNKEYRNEYNLLPVNHTVVVNGWDIVTSLPSRRYGNRHVGKKYQLKQPLWHRWLRRIRDHYHESYSRTIQRKWPNAY